MAAKDKGRGSGRGGRPGPKPGPGGRPARQPGNRRTDASPGSPRRRANVSGEASPSSGGRPAGSPDPAREEKPARTKDGTRDRRSGAKPGGGKHGGPKRSGPGHGGAKRNGPKPSRAKTDRADRRRPPGLRGGDAPDGAPARGVGPLRAGTRGREAASAGEGPGPDRGTDPREARRPSREDGGASGAVRGPRGIAFAGTGARGARAEYRPAQPSSAPVEEGTSERIQKRLAAAGLGSRRTVDQWVAEGRVRVNGRVAAAGTRIRSGDRVRIDGRRVFVPPAADTCRLLLYHKPPGEVTTRRDPEGRRTVFESLPRLRSERWVAVGRLDINTSGLILFATLGELAHRLMHPRYRMEREYAVRVLGRVDAEMIRNLRRGVALDDGPARFLDIEEEGGEGANRWFRVVLEEGRNREVHRLWESQGVRVSRLIRVRFGPVRLPSRLPAGAFMDVPDRERAALFETVELEDPGPPAAVRRRALPRAR